MPIQIATDGSCIQQGSFRKGDEADRPGAAGFVAEVTPGNLVSKAQPYANGTIGEMEIKGLRMALEFAEKASEKTGEAVHIKCDSQFVVNGFNDWLKGWAAKGYNKKGGLTGAADWREIDRIKQKLGNRLQVTWVKAHNGDKLNEACDQIVNGAARSQEAVDTTHLAFGDSPSRSKAPVEVSQPSPSVKPAATGIHVQAASLIAEAAQNPELAALLTEGLGMALEQRRLTASYPAETVNAAQTLHAALEQRANSR